MDPAYTEAASPWLNMKDTIDVLSLECFLAVENQRLSLHMSQTQVACHLLKRHGTVETKSTQEENKLAKIS
jgi:hypothetical protein